MEPLVILGIAIAVLLVALALGVPIGFSILLGSIAGVSLSGSNLGEVLTYLGLRPFGFIFKFTLIVVPLFILMGHFAFFSGISEGLYDFAFKWVGRLRGGLAMASVTAAAAFSAVTGSSAATCATIGKISLPEMKRYGYDDKLATGTMATAGVLGNLIPPSILLVMYGFLVRESIGALLIAGVIPGILTALMFMVSIYVRCRLNPSLAPVAAEPTPWKDKFVAFKGTWGVWVLFLLVVGSIYLGIATPTEAGALGCVAALIIATAMRRLTWSKLQDALLETGKVMGMIFLILAGASVLMTFVSTTGLTAQISQWVGGINVPKILILASLLLIYIPLGMFLEPLAMMILTLPIIYPIVMQLGFNGVWFGLLVVKATELGMITPPVGINVFVIAGIAPGVKTEDIFRGCFWFLITDLVTIAILIIFPQIALWLPGLMIK